MPNLSPTLKVIKAEIARQEIGLYTLAAEVGVAASTLYRILDGDFVPNFQVIENLLKALKLKLIVRHR